jgi:hypothetical protein
VGVVAAMPSARARRGTISASKRIELCDCYRVERSDLQALCAANKITELALADLRANAAELLAEAGASGVVAKLRSAEHAEGS